MNENNNVEYASVEANGVSGVLGNPEGFIRGICGKRSVVKTAALVVGLSVGGAAVFGFGAGSFVDWQVALLDALKSGGIVLFSYLLCLPALYVFNSITGCRVGFARLALVGFTVLAGIGCVLAALAPVLWLFAVSTKSATLFTMLAFAMIVGAFIAGLRPLLAVVRAGAVEGSYGLLSWLAMVLLVALQMITMMRPMLSPIGTERSPEGKCFFLEHFADCAEDEVQGRR